MSQVRRFRTAICLVGASVLVPLLAYAAPLPCDPGRSEPGCAIAAAEQVSVLGIVAVGRQPHGVAVDPTTHLVYVANSGSDTVSVFNGITLQIVGSVAVRGGPSGIGVDPSLGRVYVENMHGWLSVLDARTNRLIATIPTGAEPDALAVDASRHQVYVGGYADPETLARFGLDQFDVHSTALRVIDGVTNRVTALVPLVAGSTDNSMQVDLIAVEDGTHAVYVSAHYKYHSSITAIDGASHQATVLDRSDHPFVGMSADPVTHRLYIAPDPGVLSYVDTRVDRAEPLRQTSLEVLGYPLPIAIDPPTHTIYVAHGTGRSVHALDEQNVFVVDEETDRLLQSVPVGTHPWSLAVDSSMHSVFVANQDSDTVTVLVGLGHEAVPTAIRPSLPSTGAGGGQRRRTKLTARSHIPSTWSAVTRIHAVMQIRNWNIANEQHVPGGQFLCTACCYRITKTHRFLHANALPR